MREAGLRATSATRPAATIVPPAAPAPGPSSISQSASRSTFTS